MRFQDQGESIWDFNAYRIIHCSNCKKPIDFKFKENRIVCPHCVYTKYFVEKDIWHKSPEFISKIETYLKINCCGNILWAFNLEHLEFIKEYVQAELRERQPNINRSLASRLPQWIKTKKNRAEILKCIDKLKKQLYEDGYLPSNQQLNNSTNQQS